MSKNIIFKLLNLGLILLLIGCSSNNENSDKKELRIAFTTEIDSLDPYRSTAGDSETILDSIYDGLFGVDEEGNLIPNMAKKVDISEDRLTYSFELRDDIDFHNGEHFTADDVIYSYEKLSGFSSGNVLNEKYANVKTVEKIDDYNVNIILKEIEAEFLSKTTKFLVPKDYDNHEVEPIGAGPFKFVHYKTGEELKLEKNENYYLKEHTPKIDELYVLKFPDPQTSILALKSGEIDMLPGLSTEDIKDLEEMKILRGPQNMVQILGLNNHFKPLNDMKVRQAISYAINKVGLVDMLNNGGGVMVGSNFSPAMKKYYKEGLENYYAYNVEKAKTLLEEAGYKDGFKLKIAVPSNYQYHVDTAQIIVNDLAKVGIIAEIDLMEFTTWLDKVYTNAEFEATVVAFVGRVDPNDILVRFKSDYKFNFTHFASDEYDAVLNEANKETDDEKIVDLYKKAQEILTEDAASVFIQDPERIIAMGNNISGLKIYPIQRMNFEDVVID